MSGLECFRQYCTVCQDLSVQNLWNITVSYVRAQIFQAILEDGESQEVEDIKSSSWFQKMRVSNSVT